jgi:hypothetical protein
MPTFVAVYRGDSVASAKLIAVTAEPDLGSHVSGRLLRRQDDGPRDPVITRLERGRRSALRLISEEAGHADAR